MNTSWKDFQFLRPHTTSFIKILFVILVLDIGVSIVASYVLEEHYYFEKYLMFNKYEKKNTSHYEEIVDKYFNNAFPVKPNKDLGWVNQANHHDNDWETDLSNNRASIGFQKARQPFSQRDKNTVFLLGSSVLGGHGTKHAYEDTPGYYLNRNGYHTLDFSTAVYSIDQSYTFYKNHLSEHSPKVLVIGIHNTAEAISNMFNPLMDHDFSIPFLKPAYYWENGRLKRVMPPTEPQREKSYSQMVTVLERYDSQYYKYELYKRLSLLPLSDFLRQLILKLDNHFYYDVDAYMNAIKLQQHFMREFVKLGRSKGVEVIFIKFEALYDMEKPLYQRLLSDYLVKDKNTRHTEALRNTPFNIIYMSDIFLKAERPISDFFIEGDGLHLNSGANKLLADAIALQIEDTIKQSVYH